MRSRHIVDLCKRTHEVTDEFMKVYNFTIKSEIHRTWKMRFDGDAARYESYIKIAILDQKLIFDKHNEQELRQNALQRVVFGNNSCETEGSNEEMYLIHKLFQHVSIASRLDMSTDHMWFVSPNDVVIDAAFARGLHGSVHTGCWKGSKVVVEYQNSQNRDAFIRESDVWFKLQHPSIVQLYGACHVGNLFFVNEHAANGTLSYFSYRTRDRAKTWEKLYQAACGLQYLHDAHNVVHGNLKCNNILVGNTKGLGDGPAKLFGFGHSFNLSENAKSVPDPIGAIRWKAPEVIEGQTRGSFASDIYSFGMCILEAVTGRLPWGNVSDMTVKFRLKSKQFLRRPDVVSDAQWDLIRKMCSWMPFERPTMKFVVSAMKSFAFNQPKSSSSTQVVSPEFTQRSRSQISIENLITTLNRLQVQCFEMRDVAVIFAKLCSRLVNIASQIMMLKPIPQR